MKTEPLSSTPEAMPADKAKTGIRCEFKPPREKRVIRYATDEQVKKSNKTVMERYHEAFRELAK